jgi:hypothetical protein
MSDFSHRKINELKVFIRKYNEHFKIKLTGKNKNDLINAIESGMKKTVSDSLKEDYEKLKFKVPKSAKPLEPSSDKKSQSAMTRKGRKPSESMPISKSKTPEKPSALPMRKSRKTSVVPKGSHRMPDGSIMKDSDMKKPKLPKRDVKKALAKMEEEKKPKKKTTIKISSKSIKAPMPETKKTPQKPPKKADPKSFKELIDTTDFDKLVEDAQSVRKTKIRKVVKNMIKAKIIEKSQERKTLMDFVERIMNMKEKEQKDKLDKRKKQIEELQKE